MDVAGIRERLKEGERFGKVLPAAAVEKIAHLQQDAEDKFAAIREVSSKRSEVGEMLAQVKSEVVRLSGDRFVVSASDVNRNFAPPVATAKRELDLLQTELEKLEKSYPERTRVAHEAGELIDNLKTYARALRTSVAAFKGSVEPKLGKGETAPDAVERLRRRGRELDADRARVEASPVPSIDAKKAGHQQIAELAASGAPHVFDLVQFKGGKIRWPEQTMRTAILNSSEGVVGMSTHPDALAILAHIMPDQFIAAIDRQIDQLSDDKHALDELSRAKALQTIADDKLAVEREEEELIERLARDRIVVARRPNADPRAVLGLAATAPVMADILGEVAA